MASRTIGVLMRVDAGYEYPVAEATGFEHASAMLSRRQLLAHGSVGLGALAGVGLVDAGLVFARSSKGPRPIPGGFNKKFQPISKHPFVHVLPPGIGFEMSTITDFKGLIAASEIRGTAHGSDGTKYDFDTDMRFMHGAYVGLDGRMRHGAFGFV